MKKIKATSFLVLISVCFNMVNAQTNFIASNTNKVVYTSAKTESSKIVFIEEYAGDWVLGFGVNTVEDDGAGHFGDIFEKSSSHFSNPFILSAEYYTSNQFSFNTSLSFNKYIAGKTVDGGIIQEGKEPMYMALDVSTKYSFRELLKSNWFEPYVLLGAGYTNIGSYTKSYNEQLNQIPSVGRLTLNGGFGSNFWFSEAWGVNLNFLAKQGVKSGKNKAYINGQTQFSIGGLYRIPNIKMNWNG